MAANMEGNKVKIFNALGNDKISIKPCGEQQPLSMTVQCDGGDTIDVTYDAPAVPDRGTWSGQFDFLITCISYAVGLGNVWRFPYLCYKNGGGAFLIPYTLMLMLLGLPLFFLEFAFGQFASLGPISVWNISPLFKGIGYAMMLCSWILLVYYQIVVSHCIYFFIASFTSSLPWANCGNWWNTDNCFDGSNITENISFGGLSTPPTEEYYYNHVLGLTSGIDSFGTPSWRLTLCLAASWIICALAVIKGVQSLGKVSYFTTLFPYFLLTILLIRSCLLPGSLQGIVFYLYPQFSRLLDPRVWVEAATQIFFSLSCCNGGLIAMSSFNKFKNNCCRDAIIVACINCATSVYAGFVIFANLGFMAHVKNTTVSEVARSGPGLAFVVYPEAMTNMPLPSLWSILFFFMMCTLGFGSQFSILEAVISGLQDELRRVGRVFTGFQQVIFRGSICAFNFLLGLPMVCGGGYYLFYLVDNFLAGYPLLFIAIAETLVICYVYGLKQFRRDVEMMTKERPNWYWRLCWMAITPLISLGLIIFLFTAGEEFHLGDYRYPPWALSIGHMVSAGPVLCIPIWFIYKYCREGGIILLREFLKPAHEWGPARGEDRAEFISIIRSNESLRRSRLNNASSALFPTAITNGSQLQLGFGLGGSVVSGLAGTGIIDDTGFFQSKLSVAEKLTQAHTKEVMKRAASNTEFTAPIGATGVLTASQTALAAAAAASSAALLALGQQQQQQQFHPLERIQAESTSNELMTTSDYQNVITFSAEPHQPGKGEPADGDIITVPLKKKTPDQSNRIVTGISESPDNSTEPKFS